MTVISSLMLSAPFWSFQSYFTTCNYSDMCSSPIHFLTLDRKPTGRCVQLAKAVHITSVYGILQEYLSLFLFCQLKTRKCL